MKAMTAQPFRHRTATGAPATPRTSRRTVQTILALTALLAVAGCDRAEEVNEAVASAPASGGGKLEALHPTRHFTVSNPANLDGGDAEAIYERIVDEMVGAYRLTGNLAATHYLSWRRFNAVPYRSATHGERFVNNYGNGKAEGYGREEVPMPVGAILVKDAFTVTRQGDVYSGPLAVMEKMAPGFDSKNRDWRYLMVMPDGNVFGVSQGVGAQRVAFCGDCHRTAGDADDHLFFVPEPYRKRVLLRVPTAGNSSSQRPRPDRAADGG